MFGYLVNTVALFFNLLIGIEPFWAFRLVAEPHAVTQCLFYSKWTETLFCIEKHLLMQVYVCNTVTVA